MVSILFRSSLQDLHPQPNLDIFTLVFRFLCITIQSPCSFLRDQFIFQPNLSSLLVSISFFLFDFFFSTFFSPFIPLYRILVFSRFFFFFFFFLPTGLFFFSFLSFFVLYFFFSTFFHVFFPPQNTLLFTST